MEFKLDESTKHDISFLVNAFIESIDTVVIEYLEEKGIRVSKIEYKVESVNVDTFINYNFDLLEKETGFRDNSIFDIVKERK